MANKIAFLFSLAIMTSAKALEFPKLCPNPQNMPRICEELSKISSNKSLVFSDGFQMPACAMMTSNPDEKEYVNVKKEIMYRIGSELHAMGKLDRITASEVFRNPNSGREKFPKLASYFDKLNEIKRSTENTQNAFPVQNVEIQSTAKWAKKEILNLAFRQSAPAKLKKSVTDQLNHIELEDVNLPEQIVPCRPDVNSFFETREGGINLTTTRALYPPLARLLSLGHELGHNMDSCRIESKGPHPLLPKLEKCLQKDVGRFVSPVKGGFCDMHGSEAFSDHIGVHLVELRLKEKPPTVQRDEIDVNSNLKMVMPPGYDIIFGRLVAACNEGFDASDKASPFPTAKHRLYDIIMKNPEIAKALHCENELRGSYCDVEKGTLPIKVSSPGKK